jgi:DNA-directed RNA polymerase subunit RPC12/RpoP
MATTYFCDRCGKEIVLDRYNPHQKCPRCGSEE